jgi:thioesterase domain-containing protein
MIDLKRFEAECRLDIPLLNAMQLSFVSFEDLTLTMEAPLAPNINNKGTAFGGSIASICLFGGWAVSTLAFIDNDIHNTEIVVFKNDMHDLKGVIRVACDWTSMLTCFTTTIDVRPCTAFTLFG